MTGRCVFSFKTQTALKSKVLRVAVSKYGFRAHKGNFGISGSHDIFSSIEPFIDRSRKSFCFNSTGIPVRPTSLKFKNSAYFWHRPAAWKLILFHADSTAWALVTSQIVASPVSLRQSAYILNLLLPVPGRVWGSTRLISTATTEDRCAGFFLTAWAIFKKKLFLCLYGTWSDMIVMLFGPILVLPTENSIGSGWNFLLSNL